MIKADSIIKLNSKELGSLAEKFYNDTFYIDQNACSSPHLVYWIGKKKYKLSKKKILGIN